MNLERTVLIAGCGQAVLWLLLCRGVSTTLFLVIFSAAFLIYLIVLWGIRQSGGCSKKTFFLILLFSVLFRVMLLPSDPIHENDIYRYLWDGKVFAGGVNPYRFAPADLENAPAEIGYRTIPTIYPPVAQMVFAGIALIRPDSVLTAKAVFVLFDILVIGMVVLLLVHFGRDPALVAVYAWSPLVLKEIANSGHYDSLPVFLMMAGVYFLSRKRPLAGSVALACGIAAKFFTGALLAVYAKRLRWRSMSVVLAICAGMFIPFILWQNTGLMRVFEGLVAYSRQWAFNGSLFVLAQSLVRVFSPQAAAGLIVPKIVCALVFLAALGYLSSLSERGSWVLLHRAFIAMALLFLLNPVGDPWYYCWVMPFLCFFPYPSFILLSWLLGFSYLFYQGSYGFIEWGAFRMSRVSALEYSLFYAFLLGEFLYRKLQRGR